MFPMHDKFLMYIQGEAAAGRPVHVTFDTAFVTANHADTSVPINIH